MKSIPSLNDKFMLEIGKIKNPEFFLGVAAILKVQLMDGENGRDFSEVFKDCVVSFDGLNKKRKKELLSILKEANRDEEEE